MNQQRQQPQLLMIDHTLEPYNGELLYPFAVEELLCRQVGKGELPPIAYFWRHQKGLVLGLRDRRLPYAQKAIAQFEQDDFQVAVRHSGGAAVPLDDGVVNVSLILPKPKGRIDFYDDFETMYSLVKHAVEPLASKVPVIVEKGEITESYCPGDFDLSINRKKFCGLAQRRQTLALSVQAFIIASGNGLERAKQAQRYYDVATSGRADLDYPRVSSDSMASLNELVNLATEAELVRALKQELGRQYERIEQVSQLPLDRERINRMIAQLKNRYAKDRPHHVKK